MFFLNLSAGEFLAILGVAGGILTALYLIDRSKRKRLVSTLRFWTPAFSPDESRRRRRMRDPWSLLLQLLSLLFLLLAIAQLQWGSRERSGRDHVLLLDTSSWSSQRTAGGTLLDAERSLAARYVQRLPARDRVMLVRADALAAPATAFTSDRAQLAAALRESTSGPSALNIQQALSFARQAQNWSDAPPGEIVYTGPKLIAAQSEIIPAPPNLRLLSVSPDRENCGILHLAVKRSDSEINGWRAIVTLKNYGLRTHSVRLSARYAGTPFAPRTLALPTGREIDTEYSFTTDTAGRLTVSLDSTPDPRTDALSVDNTASLQLPRNRPLRVTVVTGRPAVLAPLLAAYPRLIATFSAPSAYSPKPNADLLIFDRIAPAPPSVPSLYIEPPQAHSPIPVLTVASDAVISQWNSDSPLAAGLHSKETRLALADVFSPAASDITIAAAAEGPVAVARPAIDSAPAFAVVGFDPLVGSLRFQVATPLLFANLLRWLAPESFHTVDFAAAPVGAVSLTFDPAESAAGVRATDENGFAVPFTLRNRTLQLFTNRPSVIRVSSADRQRVLSLTLPDIAPAEWKPPATPLEGLPAASSFLPSATDLWQLLAILAGLCLLAEWLLYGNRRSRVPLLLKGIGFAAILAALFQPSIALPESKTGVVVLVDTSLSIPPADLDYAAHVLAEMQRARGRNWMKIVPFSAQIRSLLPQEISSNSVRLVQTASAGFDATNLEAALTGSMAAIPSGHIPRLVLLSDGNANEGSTARALAELQRLRVPVDTIPLAGRTATALRLDSLSLPPEAYAGEQIPIDLTVDCPRAARATVTLSADGKSLGSNPLLLNPGANRVRVHARLNTAGVTSIAGKLSAGSLGELLFEQAIQLKRAKVLYLSGDPAGTETNLFQAFHEADYDLIRDASLLKSDLSSIQLVVLNNLDLSSLPAPDKTRLEDYVKSGGGLLLIGGERQVYKEDKQLDALDRALPAKLAPPKKPEGTAVALIIDKSSSMEGRKIELARLSAIGVVDHLRPIDYIGVLIFDNSFQWAVPMRRAEDKSIIKRLISGITPDGGTQIAPALAEAYRKVLPSKATNKHLVLLTDGISEEGDSIDLAREAQQHQVTISTVGLGQDVNRGYLEKVADTSGGRSYFLNEPQGLEQILLKDVQDYSGATSVEKPLTPIVLRKAEVLDGTDFESAPPLKGYVRFTAKPEAETILDIDPEKKDPLYVRWQYGLGRAAVFTSDAKSRWASSWVGWPGFDKFWINVTRDLLSHTGLSEASARFDTANSDVLVTYRLAAGVPEPASIPPIFVLGPHGFEKPIPVRKISSGLYTGRLHTGRVRGLFRVRPVADSAAFPEIGLYRQPEELADFGSNEPLLRQISSLTGGRFNPPPASIFQHDGRTLSTSWRLWPALLGLAILLTLLELIARKWSGLVAGLRRP